MENQDIQQTLNQRGSTHGPAKVQFYLTQVLKESMRGRPRRMASSSVNAEIIKMWEGLDPVAQEALDTIMMKAARIICGQADFHDHWHDIQGYSKIGERECCPPLVAPAPVQI